ncbi:hypothetical protein ACFL2T_02720 [Elusimicrobiota bacterium]
MGFVGAKGFFESRADLRSHPEFQRLLAIAESDAADEERAGARRELIGYAYPIALALGEIDSDGLAPSFYAAELEQDPIDYEGIIRRFDGFKAHFGGGMRLLGPLLEADAAQERRESWRENKVRLEAFMREQSLALGVPLPPEESEPPSSAIDKTRGFAFRYVQKEYRLEDMQGDVSLLVFTKAVPKALLGLLFDSGSYQADPASAPHIALNPVVEVEREPPPTEESILNADIPESEKEKRLVELKNRRLVIEGRERPLRPKEMRRMFAQILAEELGNGIAPRPGRPHRWSPEFLAEYGETDAGYVCYSKLLTALASGVTARFMVTDKELPLLDYILKQKDESITIDRLFRESYRLNDGDVYLSLLTANNVLSEFWRVPQRQNRAVSRKLALITNHYQGRGDKYGAWSHLFGIMLYGYVAGRTKAGLVGFIESMGSHLLDGFGKERQEDLINGQGAMLGSHFADMMRNKEYLEFDADGVDYTDPKIYMNLNEDFRDRIHIVESKDISAELANGSLYLRSRNADYVDCKLEVMMDFGFGIDSRDKFVREHVDIRKSGRKSFNVGWQDTKGVRAFLSGCAQGREAVVSAEDPFVRP